MTRTHMPVRHPRICSCLCGLRKMMKRFSIVQKDLTLMVFPLSVYSYGSNLRPLVRFHSQFVHARAPLFGPLSAPSPFPFAAPAPSSARAFISPSSFIVVAACLTSCCGLTC